jgi:hypothetical protein
VARNHKHGGCKDSDAYGVLIILKDLQVNAAKQRCSGRHHFNRHYIGILPRMIK